MSDIKNTNAEGGSLIEGIRQGNARQWERFSRVYAGWIKDLAGLSLSPNHTAWTDDVAQSVILRLLRGDGREPIAAGRDFAQFRDDLAVAVRQEARKITKEPDGPKQLAVLAEQAEESLETDEIMKTLKGVLKRIRTASHPTDAIAWQCFEDRLLRNRPGGEIAEWYKIDISLVYRNVHQILETILKVLREDYREQFPDQAALLRKLEELSWRPEMLEDVSGDALADELKAIDAITIDADVYFRRKLRQHWPTLEAEAGKSGPGIWAGFLAHVRAISLGQSPTSPGPDVDRMLALVDRTLRQWCLSEFGELKLYHHVRLAPDGQGIDADAAARLCGSVSREGSTHVDSKLPR